MANESLYAILQNTYQHHKPKQQTLKNIYATMTAIITQINFKINAHAEVYYNCKIPFNGSIDQYRKQITDDLKTKHKIEVPINLIYKTIAP